eukprot:g33259.t1
MELEDLRMREASKTQLGSSELETQPRTTEGSEDLLDVHYSTDEFARRYFHILDSGGTGLVPFQEMERTLRTKFSGPRLPVEEGSKDNGTHVDFEEFVQHFHARIDHLHSVFSHVDADGDGFLSQDEVKQLLGKLHVCTANKDKLKCWLNRVDPEGKNKICFPKFRNLFFNLPLDHPRSIPKVDSAFDSNIPVTLRRETESVKETLTKLFNGALAGVVSRTATAPIDRVRLLMQASTRNVADLSALQTFLWIGRVEGIRAYWQGNGGNLIKIAPDQACMYLSFDWAQSRFCLDRDNPTLTERFLSGGFAGSITAFCVYPLDLVRTRLAVKHQSAYKGAVDCMRQTYLEGGLRGFYTGCSLSVLGNIPFCGIQLGVAELLKDMVKRRYTDGVCPGMGVLLSCGMISSCVALTATYPVWLLRVKLQTQGYNGVPTYNGFLDCVRKTATGGIRQFYRGLLPSALKVVPATGISYAVYTKLDCVRREMFPQQRPLNCFPSTS